MVCCPELTGIASGGGMGLIVGGSLGGRTFTKKTIVVTPPSLSFTVTIILALPKIANAIPMVSVPVVSGEV
jgi:hypothetical protein